MEEAAPRLPPASGVPNETAAMIVARYQRLWQQARALPDPAVSKPVSLTAHEQHQRQTMLRLLRECWIDGVLEPARSLHATLAPAGEEHPARESVSLRQMQLWIHAPPAQPASAEASHQVAAVPPMPHPLQAAELPGVFAQAQQRLLVLGEPGTGKTHTLLELLEMLVRQAETSENAPIPVFLSLASWANHRAGLEAWLLEELHARYGVSQRIGQQWLEQNRLLLLLDDLDALPPRQVLDRVRKLRYFRISYPDMGMVVCSRVADREALSVYLDTPVAVLLEPVQPAGSTPDSPPRTALEAALHLRMQAAATADTDAKSDPAEQDDTAATVARYLQQRTTQAAAGSVPALLPGLKWLATQMQRHNQHLVTPELLQPSWLPVWWQRLLYILLLTLATGLPIGLFVGLLLGPVAGLVVGVLYGLSWGLAPIRLVEPLRWSWRRAREDVIGGLILGLMFGIVGFFTDSLVAIVAFALFGGLTFTLIFILDNSLIGNVIEDRSSLRQTIGRATRNGVLSGLIGLAMTVLVFGLVAGMIAALVLGQGNFFTANDVLVVANQSGFWWLLLLALLITLSIGSLVAVQHSLLRLLLARVAGVAPTNLHHLLEPAVQAGLLYKAGNSYLFLHPALRDVLAGAAPEEQRPAVVLVKPRTRPASPDDTEPPAAAADTPQAEEPDTQQPEGNQTG